jgi:hypothetical protein
MTVDAVSGLTGTRTGSRQVWPLAADAARMKDTRIEDNREKNGREVGLMVISLCVAARGRPVEWSGMAGRRFPQS